MALEDIAGYSLRRKLGSGSAGTVWLVRDRASGRNAVLKRVPTTAISHPEDLREHLTVLQRIDHPHIARLREFRETGTEWLLFSQYVVAGTLTALLTRRGPLTDGELVTLLSPLAEALDYLHRTGLTHGRVTPANIMFDADGRPVLTDAVLHTTQTSTPTEDLTVLVAVAHQAGGDPTVFTPDLFTTTHPHDLLTLTPPIPINLAFTQDPPPTDTPDDPTATSDDPTTSTTSPRPRPTPKPPTTDDPLHRSRVPLTPPPKKPPTPHTPQPKPPQPPPPKPPPRSTNPTRRKPRLPHLTRRTRPTPTPINPLTRLTPLPPAHTTDPTGSPPSRTPAAPPLANTSSTESASGFARPPRRSSRTALRRRRTWRRRSARWTRLMQPVHGLASRMAPSKKPGSTSLPRTSGTALGTSGSAASTAVGRRSGLHHPAYGVLAAVGLGAAVALILGLLTFNALDNPTGTAAATDRTEQSPSPAPSPSPTTATRSPSREDTGEWTRTLQALDTQRAQAFWTLDPALLDTIYVPGTAPWAADRALLATYRRHQIRVRGLQIRIDKTTIESQTPSTVVLRTIDHLTAGQAIAPTGTATTLPPGTPTTRRITLTTTPPTHRPTTSPWRITAITSA